MMAPEGPLAASFEGSVIIDIGGDVGALVVYADATERGRELEITPEDGGCPTHTSIRERVLPGGTVDAAVFPALRAGRYRVPARGRCQGTEITVRPGAVIELDLRFPSYRKEALDG